MGERRPSPVRRSHRAMKRTRAPLPSRATPASRRTPCSRATTTKSTRSSTMPSARRRLAKRRRKVEGARRSLRYCATSVSDRAKARRFPAHGPASTSCPRAARPRTMPLRSIPTSLARVSPSPGERHGSTRPTIDDTATRPNAGRLPNQSSGRRTRTISTVRPEADGTSRASATRTSPARIQTSVGSRTVTGKGSPG